MHSAKDEKKSFFWNEVTKSKNFPMNFFAMQTHSGRANIIPTELHWKIKEIFRRQFHCSKQFLRRKLRNSQNFIKDIRQNYRFSFVVPFISISPVVSPGCLYNSCCAFFTCFSASCGTPKAVGCWLGGEKIKRSQHPKGPSVSTPWKHQRGVPQKSECFIIIIIFLFVCLFCSFEKSSVLEKKSVLSKPILILQESGTYVDGAGPEWSAYLDGAHFEVVLLGVLLIVQFLQQVHRTGVALDRELVGVRSGILHQLVPDRVALVRVRLHLHNPEITSVEECQFMAIENTALFPGSCIVNNFSPSRLKAEGSKGVTSLLLFLFVIVIIDTGPTLASPYHPAAWLQRLESQLGKC